LPVPPVAANPSALAHNALRDGHTAGHLRALRLMQELPNTKADGPDPKLILDLAKIKTGNVVRRAWLPWHGSTYQHDAK